MSSENTAAQPTDAGDRHGGWPIHRHERIDSTNLEVLRLAERGARPGTVVVAGTQTAGRGRLGRGWRDLPGKCLLMSALLEPPAQARGLLTAAMALAAAEAIAGLGAIEPRIKWPNDVMIEERKVAGVLAEGRADGPVAVGLGVNVNGTSADLPEEVRDRACFISESLRREVSLSELEAAVLRHLSAVYDDLLRGESATVIDGLSRRDYLAGRAISVTMGGQVLRGTARGWMPDGRLLLCDEEGRETRLEAGEVTVN